MHTIEIELWREESRVKGNAERSIKIGTLATLTLEEWLAQLEFFDRKCAYCQKVPFFVLDHILPICFNGDTTKENCVPCCASCNALKKEYIPYTPEENLTLLEKVCRVREYIQSRVFCIRCQRITFHDLIMKDCLRCGYTPKEWQTQPRIKAIQ